MLEPEVVFLAFFCWVLVRELNLSNQNRDLQYMTRFPLSWKLN